MTRLNVLTRSHPFARWGRRSKAGSRPVASSPAREDPKFIWIEYTMCAAQSTVGPAEDRESCAHFEVAVCR
jgi:hypothetical protein